MFLVAIDMDVHGNMLLDDPGNLLLDDLGNMLLDVPVTCYLMWLILVTCYIHL